MLRPLLDDAYDTAEDLRLDVVAPGILGNDDDVDGDALSAVLVTGPTRGTLTLEASGAFSYSPNANQSGADSFTYRAVDPSGTSSAITTVAITVAAVPDAPVAANDSYTVANTATLNVAAPGVLANDTDADGDTLSATLVTGPAVGTLTLNANGSFSYDAAVRPRRLGHVHIPCVGRLAHRRRDGDDLGDGEHGWRWGCCLPFSSRSRRSSISSRSTVCPRHRAPSGVRHWAARRSEILGPWWLE